MNVLLIQPASTDRGFIHLGLGFIAASLEGKGHNVKILDMGIENGSLKRAEKIIRQSAPDVAGIAALTPTYPTALKIAELIKRINPQCITVFGGNHACALPDEVLAGPAVDIVVRGEGEITMCEIMDALKEHRDPVNIQGVSYKKNGGIIHNAGRPLIEDLDMLPSIPWHLFEVEKYTGNINGRRAVGISASRGCPYSCVFCYRGPSAGKTIRYWSPERVLKEIKFIKERYGITGFHFWNDVFTHNKKWVHELCDLFIKEGLNIEWDCQTRADQINEDVLRKMKQAGCTAVMLGVESGSEEVLKYVDKKLTKDQIRAAFKMLHEIGFVTTATFTLGLPWDTRETVQETIDFAKEINPDFGMFYLSTPFPGSPLWRMCEAQGIKLSRDWANFRIIPFEVDLKNVLPVFDTSKLSVGDLKKFIKTAQIEFQLGRLRRGQGLKGLRNIVEIFALVFRRSKSVKKLLKLIFRVIGDTFYLIRIKLANRNQ
ncbi:MAG: radical SAM protein [Nitrospiraceae bacterium]|nr:MAG: radical SAM protein [Nitrospiraceae bacterium]